MAPRKGGFSLGKEEMAISVAQVTQGGLAYRISGAEKKTVTDVTMDSGYVTGGEPVTAAQLGFSSVCNSATAQIKTTSGAGVNVASCAAVVQTDGSVNLKCHDETPAEVANAADIATTIIRVTATGT
jgi:hypothetical protein